MAFPTRLGINTGNATGTNGQLTISYPTESSSGDLIILAFNSGTTNVGAYTVSSISGGPTWTLLESFDATASSGLRWDIYWGIRGSETSVTISHSKSTNFRGVFGRTIAYDGTTVDQSNPVQPSAINAAVTSGSATAPTITTNVADCEVLGLAFAWRSGTGTNFTASWNNSFTEIADESTASNSTYRVNLNSAVRQFATSGSATGNCTVSWSPSTSIAARGGAQIAIRPVQDQTKNDSDSAGASETATVTATQTVTDSAGASETATVTATQTVTDSAGASETTPAAIAFTRTDSAGATEFALGTKTDSAGATETATVTATLTATDSAGASETEQVSNAVTATDSAGATEATAQIAQTATDSAGGSDTQTGIGLDSAGATEALSQITFTATDSAGANDTATATVSAVGSDSAGASDTGSVTITVVDSAGATDLAVPPGFDNAGASETQSLNVFASDSAGVTETAQASALITDSDSAGATDAHIIGISQTDSAGATDVVTSQTASVPSTDSAGATDVVLGFAFTLADSAGATETAPAGIAFTRTDSAGATDTQSLNVLITSTDSAGATESVPVVQLALLVDSFGWDDDIAFRVSDQLAGLPRVRVVEVEDRARVVVAEGRKLIPASESRDSFVEHERRRLRVPATSTTFDVEAGS